MLHLPELNIYSHQDAVALSDALLIRLKLAARGALPITLAHAASENSALSTLNEVEVSIVDDETIADVHVRFMDIEGATDVITFDHGEIHISVETAQAQAIEYGNDYERELMLYIVHGLLHLAGHEDASDEGNALMDRLQQEILSQVWNV
ncbi:MAG: rRNA maturation RNase YbeY [Akkermansiaceae bacterium]